TETIEDLTSTTESTTVHEEVLVPTVSEQEVSVVKQSLDEQGIDHEETTTTGLVDKLKSLLPSSLTSTKIEHITSEESAPTITEDQVPPSSSFTETIVISSPAAGYFTSSDVYHAYKQPVEPIIVHKKDSSSFIDKATAFATSIISSVTSALPTTETADDLTSTTESTTLHEEVLVPTVSEQE
ncbi:unnamed protein product, partial [Rotaria sp. Silwood2]